MQIFGGLDRINPSSGHYLVYHSAAIVVEDVAWAYIKRQLL